MFMPDYGTARCDFPGGSAYALYRSIRSLLTLPDTAELYVCHDYPPAGREPKPRTTVAEQCRANIHVHDGVDEQAFVEMREQRDATLEMPLLILPAVQVKMRAGHFPPPENNGIAYLKIPLNALWQNNGEVCARGVPHAPRWARWRCRRCVPAGLLSAPATARSP